MDKIYNQIKKYFTQIFLGISMSVLLFSVSLMQVLITFGQLKDFNTAKQVNILISIFFIATVILIDISFSRKSSGLCVFPIIYFLTSLLLCFISYFVVEHINFINLYGDDSVMAYRLLRTACFQISIFNSAALLVRIFIEFYIFIKRTKR